MHGDEWPREATSPWAQITGHVPQHEPKLQSGPRWAIDLGGRRGRLAGLVRAAGERSWRPVVVRARDAGRALPGALAA